MTLAAIGAWEPGGDVRLRSAVEHRLRAAGARFEPRGPWLVAAAVPGEAERLERLAFADASHLGKLEVRGSTRPADGPDREVLQVAPGRWIVICAWEARTEAAAELGAGEALVLDMSGAWSLLVLAGAERERLLRRLGPIVELPGGGPLAGVPGRAFRRSELVWVMVPVEYAQHLWDVCSDLASPLGGGPAGLDAVAARAGDGLLAAREVEVGR
jgi:hypothetical protein